MLRLLALQHAELFKTLIEIILSLILKSLDFLEFIHDNKEGAKEVQSLNSNLLSELKWNYKTPKVTSMRAARLVFAFLLVHVAVYVQAALREPSQFSIGRDLVDSKSPW